MTQEKDDPIIAIVPPICAAKGERHPQWVALTLPVELAHCGGDIEECPQPLERRDTIPHCPRSKYAPPHLNSWNPEACIQL